jgi:tetratricopeptide (TPR) repeat protein
MNDRPTLSACMIVRDEAEVIGIALAALHDFVDQIVVIDTGSRDATVDVARAHGAEVEPFAWCDDFARARNVSLQRASGDWILVLDADEWVAPGDRAALREWIAGTRDRVAELPQRNYVADASTPGFHAGDAPEVWSVPSPGYVIARQVRLIPNDVRLRYEGCVHEQLERTIGAAGLRIERLEHPVHHIGKLRRRAVLERKARLYRALGEIKVQRDPSGRALLELGVQCIELGEDERAEELLRSALASGGPLGDRAKIVAHLAGVLARHERGDEADALIRAHLADVSAYAFVWECWGSVLGQVGRTTRAAEVLERASRMFPSGAGILRLLGEAYLAVRQFDRASGAFARLRALASSGGGLGEAGLAVSAAGAGDVRLLRCLLADDRPEIRVTSRVGAKRWLGAEYALAAWPRSVAAPDEVLDDLSAALLARGRHGGPIRGGRRPAPASLEALWREARRSCAPGSAAHERLSTVLGLRKAVMREGVDGADQTGQIVQVTGTNVR